MLLIFDDKEKSLNLRLDKTELNRMAAGLTGLIVGDEGASLVRNAILLTKASGDVAKFKDTLSKIPDYPDESVDFLWKLNIQLLLKIVS